MVGQPAPLTKGFAMKNRAILISVLFVAYVLFWPVPVEPVSWQSPANPGYTGSFAANTRLKAIETLSIGLHHGPEDIALDGEGRIYAATGEGWIVRLDADGANPTAWVETGGRPLGIDFDGSGSLIVADAYLGLLSISPDGLVTILTNSVDGTPILYADDVDIAPDGTIYFSDASTKFSAAAYGSTLAASLDDLFEHGGHGRLLAYHPADGTTTMVLEGLQFANGVAVDPNGQYVLVNETGAYRVVRYWLEGPKTGTTDMLIEALPSFPDNLSIGQNGRIWIALVSPRAAALDNLSEWPFLRKMLRRAPAFMRPTATTYGHIIAVDDQGEVLENLQDPDAAYPVITSITETDDYLYLGSLVAPVMARLLKSENGID